VIGAAVGGDCAVSQHQADTAAGTRLGAHIDAMFTVNFTPARNGAKAVRAQYRRRRSRPERSAPSMRTMALSEKPLPRSRFTIVSVSSGSRTRRRVSAQQAADLGLDFVEQLRVRFTW